MIDINYTIYTAQIIKFHILYIIPKSAEFLTVAKGRGPSLDKKQYNLATHCIHRNLCPPSKVEHFFQTKVKCYLSVIHICDPTKSRCG